MMEGADDPLANEAHNLEEEERKGMDWQGSTEEAGL